MKLAAFLSDEISAIIPAWRSVPVGPCGEGLTVIVDGADVSVTVHRQWLHLRLVDGWYRVQIRYLYLFTHRARFRTIRGKR